MNGQTMTLKGIKILDLPDPLSGSAALEPKDRQEEDRILDIQTAGLQEAIKEQGTPGGVKVPPNMRLREHINPIQI
ncbi:MAG: hypothetical protein ABFC94_08685 [Syntrophomonas sp.]